MTSRQNRFERRPWLGWLTAAVLLLVLAEIGLRVINPAAVEFARDFRQIYRYHDRWYTDFIPDTSTTIRLRDADRGFFLNFLVTINPLGFRWHDRILDAPLPTDDGRLTVHTIGDSFTMGWGVNYESGYPARLQELLGQQYQVINLGLNGYGAIGATEKSLGLMDQLPASAVVYLMTENDYPDDQAAFTHSQRPRIFHSLLNGWNFLRRHSYLASTPYALRWWLYFRPGQIADAPASVTGSEKTGRVVELPMPASQDDQGRETKLAIKRYAAFLAERNVPLLIIALGRDRNAADFAGFANETGLNVRLVSLDESLLLRKEGHFNPLGNRLLAEYVAAWLADIVSTRREEN